MKRFALYIGLAAALVASCSTQEKDFQTPLQDDVVFYVSFEQPVDEWTRVYANEDLLLRWNADDRISIFNKNTYNQQYRFAGETGDNAGGFDKVAGSEFATGNAISHVVSVYPYQSASEISESESLTLTLPAEQHYAENTFGLGANTMVSVTADNFLQYKTVGGYLRLRLYGEGVSVSSITLKGNNGEKLAGKATVTMPLDGVPSVTMAEDATNEITLVCDKPVALGATAEESIQFWFVIPPVTFSKGFTVTVSGSGGVFEKSTEKSVTIERNKLSKMSPLRIDSGASPSVSVPEAVDMGLSVKWGSFNLGASKPEEYGDYYAWGEIETQYYSLEPDWYWKEDGGNGWPSYKWCYGTWSTLTKYCTDSDYGLDSFMDGKTVLDPEDDAAHMHLGGKWRMPTKEEVEELLQSCIWSWTTQNGVQGCIATSTITGLSIFFPAAGSYYNAYQENPIYRGHYYCSYWTSTLRIPSPFLAMDYVFTDRYTETDYSDAVDTQYRFEMQSIRPVYAE